MRDPHGDPRSGPSHELRPGPGTAMGPETGDGADLKTLLSRLNRDVTQLMHDELELAKLELRDVAEAFGADVQEAGRTLALNTAKVGVALTLGWLAGLALTAGAILALGVILGSYWAGAIIVGTVLLIAAAAFGWSAARDMRESESLRLERGRRTLQRDRDVLQDEARRTKEFARDEAAEFKRRASRGGGHQH